MNLLSIPASDVKLGDMITSFGCYRTVTRIINHPAGVHFRGFDGVICTVKPDAEVSVIR